LLILKIWLSKGLGFSDEIAGDASISTLGKGNYEKKVVHPPSQCATKNNSKLKRKASLYGGLHLYPFNRFRGDVHRELMKRLLVVFNDTPGSYLFYALHEGGAVIVIYISLLRGL
jgi:hypothetical protein